MEKLGEILKQIDNLDVRIKEEVKGLRKIHKQRKDPLTSLMQTMKSSSGGPDSP
jgi:hypothetical protein